MGDPIRTGPFFKSPVDVCIWRSFVLKQVSSTENNFQSYTLDYMESGGGDTQSKPAYSGPGSTSGKETEGLYFNMLI